MAKLHLHWDNINKNGVVFNGLYPEGVLYTDPRPTLPFEFVAFSCSEVFDQDNWVRQQASSGEIVQRLLTDDEVAEVFAVAASWVQLLGQDGNPNDDQLAEQARRKRHRQFALLDALYMQHARQVRMGVTPTHEIDELDAWAAALEGLPEQGGWPREVVWPVLPD